MKNTLALIAALGLVASPAFANEEAAPAPASESVQKVEDVVKAEAIKAEEAAKKAPAAGEAKEEMEDEAEGHSSH